MRHSSSSTPPSIKPQHRAAKRRATRRRRIDLECGCSFFLHLNCANNGFTHRGTHHCASSGEWRVYLGAAKSPVFQDNQRGRPPEHQHQGLPRPSPVQPQPEESVGSPQGVLQLPSLDDIPDSFWDDIFS
ncbi:transactivator protein [Melochia mosaic virus]|uniref:Transcriptional activator protein n=1 Tax=Melochia mosaic virus TaxID=1742594 RepID=A0A0N7J0P2_9GEMI|nr:transactivator protein [Melochia mosaic virus]ALK27175.1 transactivator protein [Melochia mosaic virus]